MITETRRAELRAMQAHKATRRLQLADDVSLLWESPRTVAHQVKEMLAMEEDPESQVAIITGYKELQPSKDRWTATVSVEVRDAAQIKHRLAAYAGLEHAFSLTDGVKQVRARVIGDHGTAAATTAVTYLAFDVPPRFDAQNARLEVNHPRLQGAWSVANLAGAP
ncbi:MAG: DUF3501 family protein [Thermoplasmatota archaeon]